jgi:hypothetical protein
LYFFVLVLGKFYRLGLLLNGALLDSLAVTVASYIKYLFSSNLMQVDAL